MPFHPVTGFFTCIGFPKSSGQFMATFIQLCSCLPIPVDRPFFCAIRDDQTGAILFMSAIAYAEIGCIVCCICKYSSVRSRK